MVEKEEKVIWFREDKSGFITNFVTNVLAQGPAPRHLSFIMDGNRTYSKQKGIKLIDGYKEGGNCLVNVLNWCLKYDIQEISAYAFSIENLNRDMIEISELFDLLAKMFRDMLTDMHLFHENGVTVRFIGDWDQMPAQLKPTLAKIMIHTRANSKFRFNLALMYTGRNEITRGIQQLWAGINDGRLSLQDLSVSLLDKVISISSALNPVDLLIRTSGCTRLSDYMMWQSTEAILRFIPVLWPEFTQWELQKSIFFSQRQKVLMRKLRLPNKKQEKLAEADIEQVLPENVRNFLKDVEIEYWEMIQDSLDEYRDDMWEAGKQTQTTDNDSDSN